MTKMPKKARRIEAEVRLKARALRRLRPQINSPTQPLHPVVVDRAVGKMAHTRAPCSCAMCGSPRKHRKGEERLTIAERRELGRRDASL